MKISLIACEICDETECGWYDDNQGCMIAFGPDGAICPRIGVDPDE